MGLRVMSYNARMDTTQPDGSDGDDGADAWPHRRELLLQDIRAQDPDLLGMQEVLPHMGEWLRQQLSGDYEFAGEPRGGDGTGEMMAVFVRRSRFTLLEPPGHFWLSETPSVPGSVGPEFRCERMATWVRLSDGEAGGRPLLFVNTHLDHGLPSSREFGAKVILSFLAEQAAAHPSVPVVLTGDMNAHDDSEAIRLLLSGAGDTALLDTFRTLNPTPFDLEATTHGWFRPRPDGAASGRPRPPFGKRIDYIFASPALVPTEAAIDRFEDPDAATTQGSGIGEDGGGRFGKGRFPSDHFAVTATLERAEASL